MEISYINHLFENGLFLFQKIGCNFTDFQKLIIDLFKKGILKGNEMWFSFPHQIKLLGFPRLFQVPIFFLSC